MEQFGDKSTEEVGKTGLSGEWVVAGDSDLPGDHGGSPEVCIL